MIGNQEVYMGRIVNGLENNYSYYSLYDYKLSSGSISSINSSEERAKIKENLANNIAADKERAALGIC